MCSGFSHTTWQIGWKYLGIEECLGNMVMVVKIEQNGAGARVALKGVHAPIIGVAHKIEAELPGRASLVQNSFTQSRICRSQGF